MGDKLQNVCGVESLRSAKRKADDDFDGSHSSTSEIHKQLAECLAHSVKRAKLMFKTQEKEVKLNCWNVEIAKAYIGNYCNQLIKETGYKTSAYKVIDQQLINDLTQDKDTHRLSNVIKKIINFLAEKRALIAEDVERANLFPRFYQLLGWNHQPTIQYEALDVLGLLCSAQQSPERKRTILRKLILNLCNFLDGRAVSMALSILRREVLLGEESRDLVLTGGLVSTLPVLVRLKTCAEYIESIFDISSAICDTDPLTDVTVVAQLLPLFSFFIDFHKHIGLLRIIDTITSITRMGPTYSQLIIDLGLLNKMLPLVCQRNQKSIYTAEVFQALENIATGSDEHKMALLDAGVMAMLQFAFFNGDEILLLHALSFLENFVGDDCKLLQVVVDSDYFPVIVNSILSGSDSKLHREAAMTLTNFFMVGEQRELIAMAECDAISALCDLLDSDKFVLMALKAIKSFVEICDNEEGRRLLDFHLDESSAYERIKSLQEVSSKLCQTLFVKETTQER